jgi:ABC-type branched-subunit amino acid transport system substrate-binding protein
MRTRRWPLLASLVIGVLLTSACSVSTPRHGFTRVQAVQQAQSAEGTDVAGGEIAPSELSGVGGVASGPSASGGSVGTRGGARGPTTTSGGRSSRGSPGGGQGSVATVGVTKDSIKISAIAGFSGNFGAILNKIYENGFVTWVDDVNAHGGIYGRRIIAEKVDNRDTVEGGVAACKEVINNKSYLAVSIVGFGGADIAAADCLDKAGKTTLALNLSAFSSSWRYVFSAGDAGKQTRPMATFIKRVIGASKDIGIIHVNDPLNNTTRKALVGELAREGMRLVHEETVTSGQSSFVAELNRMRASGATTVALLVNTTEVLGILRDARGLNYTPKWTGSYWPIDETSTASPALFAGIKVIRNYASTNSPAFPGYREKAQKYGHGDVTNSTTMALYGIGLLTETTLRNAGPDPTVAALGPGIERIVNYNNQITMTLSFGRGVRVATVGMWPLQCCNPDNTWKGIGPPKTRF